MTRINLIPPEFLSDQHLLAEYRELPRIVNSYKCNIYNPNKNFYKNIPTKYKLGTGHVKFFRNKIKFLLDRYKLLVKELLYRGFNISYYSEGDYNDLINIVMFDQLLTR